MPDPIAFRMLYQALVDRIQFIWCPTYAIRMQSAPANENNWSPKDVMIPILVEPIVLPES